MPIANVFPEGSGSGTVTVVTTGKKKLLATIDFSAQTNQSFTADSDVTFSTSAGSDITAISGKWKNLANLGGSMQITGGKLVANTNTVITSLFGRTYWSTLHAPVLAFDLRQFADVLADVNFKNWRVIVEADFDPMFTVSGSTYTSQVGTYCWTHAGVIQGGSNYFAGIDTYPTRFMSTAFRTEAVTGTASNQAFSIFHWSGYTPSGSSGGNNLSQFATNNAPYNAMANPGPTKWGISFSARHSIGHYETSNGTSFKYYNGIRDTQEGGPYYYQNWDNTANTNTGAWVSSSTNDLWGFIAFSRSTGSGATSVKCNKINIYIAEIP